MNIGRLLGSFKSGWEKTVSSTSGLGRSLADVFAGTDASVHKATNISNYKKLLDDGVEIDDAAKKHLDYWSDQTGGELTQEGLRAIQRDAAAGLTPGQGASAAGTVKGNMLTNAFNPVDKGMMGGLGAMTAGGLLGGGAAYATDGATEQGVLLGAIAGVGIRNIGQGLAKGLVGDMPGIEKKFVDDLLGAPSEAVSKKADVVKAVETNIGPKAPDANIFPISPNLNNPTGPLGVTQETVLRGRSNISDMLLNAPSGSASVPQVKVAAPEVKVAAPQVSARKARLDEVANMDKSNLGFWDKQKHAILTGKKDLGIAQKTRMAGAIGSALTGMAFSSSRRDHRRGFNKRRGNRV